MLDSVAVREPAATTASDLVTLDMTSKVLGGADAGVGFDGERVDALMRDLDLSTTSLAGRRSIPGQCRESDEALSFVQERDEERANVPDGELVCYVHSTEGWMSHQEISHAVTKRNVQIVVLRGCDLEFPFEESSPDMMSTIYPRLRGAKYSQFMTTRL
jgi:hypothetical protein